MARTSTMLDVMMGEIGTAEVPGGGSNPRILEYAKAAGYTPEKGDDDAWCGNSMAWVAIQCGLAPPEAPWRARSWLAWGKPSKPVVGAVAVFPRGGNPTQGHVTLVSKVDGHTLYCVGGNQGDRVSIAKFREQDALGFRVASDPPRPVATAVKSSKTILGVLLAGLGSVIQYLDQGLTVLLDAAAKAAEWSPIQGLAATLGGNVKSIGFGLAVFGIVLAITRRLEAAAKGKIG